MIHDVETPHIANATTATEEEIEITPEMINVGAQEFLECRSMMTETAEDAAADIFRAMVRASSGSWRRVS
jgi:hypothetical protein